MVHADQEKLVQVVAADVGLVAPPSRYVLREENRPTTVAKQAKLVIPIVDVSRLAMPDDVEESAKLRSALQSWGLFVVTGHGMPTELLDEILEATRKFFHLPPEEKQKCGNVIDGVSFQNEGYGIDRIDSDEQVLDWCDRLWLQLQPEDERRLQFWPQHLRELLHEYTLESGRVTMDVLKAMAKLLNQEEGFFIDMVGERFKSYSRFTYYPPCPRPDLVNGLKPHTDNSVITLLLMDKDVGGLQVLKDGNWVDVPVLGHDLLVVVGEGMEIVSNAIFKAPWHRVVTSADKERMSLAMFYQPEPERIIGPPGALVHEKRPPMFKKCLVQTLADGYWDAFAVGDRTVDFLNVRINAEADAELEARAVVANN
ncbi:2-oxoglutarate-dependent dioxygenase 11-like [Hordeum vulgare subsp. vulgare]|uniref:Fe2OG dioxygenase domain-containing protein n=1 Tax=Hordeum vulgare subsp. vulgare TaxID=112509 RepID=A0A8I6YAF0_HORVV|nr:2-oxoglutarate-dependent dioxygenase 11-like [Hordeum vulgare subsp. vulgare]